MCSCIFCTGSRMMPAALQQPVRNTITAAPHQVQLDRLAHTMWNDQNLQPQNTQQSLGVPTFLLLGMKRNAYSKAAFVYTVSHWQWDSQIRPSGPDLTGMLWAIWIPWEKKKKKKWRSVHSCHRAQLQADRVLSWDLVNVSSLSDCILMKVFYFSAERPNCNITR